MIGVRLRPVSMPNITRSFSYTDIVVIQSLLSGDEPTGRALFDEVIEPAGAKSGIGRRFVEVASPGELVTLLDSLGREAERTAMRPVLHLEMHGRPDGLYPGGIALPWVELRPSLQRLSVVTAVNVLITLASCYGAYLVNTIDPNSVAPFWGLIGPGEQVMEPEVRRGYQAFYGSLAAQADLWIAFEQLRNTVDFPDHWELYLAELILAVGFGKYYARNSGPGPLKRTEKEILKALRKTGKSGRSPGHRARIRKAVGSHDLVFSRYKAMFLMLNEYPRNVDRFPLSMDEALNYYRIHEEAERRRAEEDT